VFNAVQRDDTVGMMRRELLAGERIFVVHDLLSIDERAALLLRGEAMVCRRGWIAGAGASL
jgi:hypothetical protein